MKSIPNRTIYRCDFCSKHRLTKAAMQYHEQFCRHNPHNQHKCFSCENLVVTNEAVGVGPDGELRTAGKRFTCARLGYELYSYVAERRALVEKMPANVVRMPLNCASYESEVFPQLNPVPFVGGPEDLLDTPF